MELSQRTAVSTPGERFAAAVIEHSRSMFRAARAILDGDADAEEAVSEAVARAWQSYGTLRRAEALRPWLLRITVNCAYEQRRKQGRVTYVEDLEAIGGCAEPEGVGSLWEAVCRLPEDHRIVMTLFYYEDMTVAQISKLLGVAQGTVKSRLSRARESLKRLLQEEEL